MDAQETEDFDDVYTYSRVLLRDGVNSVKFALTHMEKDQVFMLIINGTQKSTCKDIASMLAIAMIYLAELEPNE
jgi:hypothetical protein